MRRRRMNHWVIEDLDGNGQKDMIDSILRFVL